MPQFSLSVPQVRDAFVKAYVEAAFFANQFDGHDEDVQDNSGGWFMLKTEFSADDIAPETWACIAIECAAFVELAKFHCGDMIRENDEQAGHDFWLTREGHGSGFWDRELWQDVFSTCPMFHTGEYKLGDVLSKICKRFGEAEWYVGDDGKLYQFGYESWDAIANLASEYAGLVAGHGMCVAYVGWGRTPGSLEVCRAVESIYEGL